MAKPGQKRTLLWEGRPARKGALIALATLALLGGGAVAGAAAGVFLPQVALPLAGASALAAAYRWARTRARRYYVAEEYAAVRAGMFKAKERRLPAERIYETNVEESVFTSSLELKQKNGPSLYFRKLGREDALAAERAALRARNEAEINARIARGD